MMRLRLRIERNGLPPVQTIWPVKDASHTVAQLLEQINLIFPLDADNWGLEDYNFASNGYELIHFNLLKEVLKDEDELIIKPLSWEERRARTTLGRDQISIDGRHLHDGIAFGRPYVRGPTRPHVSIPPLKRRKLEQGQEEQVNVVEADEVEESMSEDSGDDEPLFLTMNGDWVEMSKTDHAEDEEEEDSDFQPEDSDGGNDVDKPLETIPDSSDDDDTSDDESSVSDSTSSASDSSEVSSSSDDQDEEAWEGFEDSLPTSAVPSKTPPNSLKSALRKTSPDADTTSKATPETQAPNGEAGGIPNEGLAKTHSRNVRRRDAKRLKHLKDSGVVPQNMTLAEMRQLQEDGQGLKTHGEGSKDDAQAQVNATSRADANSDADAAKTAASEAGQEPETGSANDTEPAKNNKAKKVKHTTGTIASIEERRQQLLKAIHSGGVDVDGAETPADSDEAPEELTSKDQSNGVSDGQKAATMVPPSVSAAARRTKLDLDGSKRLLFGSLGVRVPKTREQKDALQSKLAEQSKRKAIQKGDAMQANGDSPAATPSKVNGEQNTPDTPDSWRNKINLTAFECADEGVKLSNPAFPFRQGWDAQYNRKGKKRKRSGQQEVDEGYDKYNTDGYGDALNYDDEGGDVEGDNEYWEDGALLDGTGEDDESDVEDLPPLPSDLKSLDPLLSPSELRPGRIITFTELTCDATTSWEPTTKRFTAEILGSYEDAHGDKMWKLRCAKRDLPVVEVDGEGKRVWGKFEMPFDEHDDVGDGGESEGAGEDEWKQEGRERQRMWHEMAEVRLVKGVEGASQ